MCFRNPTSKAIKYITTSCACIGSFHGTTDIPRFLKQVAKDMATSKPSTVFPSRYIEHVAYAVDMVASNDWMSQKEGSYENGFHIAKIE